MYPLDTHEREELKKTLTTWLDTNGIIPYDSLYGAPIFFAEKEWKILTVC